MIISSDMMDDSQMDSSDATGDVSLGHEILQAVNKGQSPSRQNVSFRNINNTSCICDFICKNLTKKVKFLHFYFYLSKERIDFLLKKTAISIL